MKGLVCRRFEAGDESAFRDLNEAWVRKYFTMEARDHAILGDPIGSIIAPGGDIVMAVVDGETVGCCALVREEGGLFEVAKMAVREDMQGRGIGEALLRAVISRAVEMGARRLFLETNGILATAIRLYERVGFRQLSEAERHPSPYARADVQMEMMVHS